MKIKICGLTRTEDIRFLGKADIDYAGFIFVPGTPRFLETDEAAALTALLPGRIKKVGVFRDEDPERIRETVRRCRLDIVQLHGSERPDYCEKLKISYFKVIRVKDRIRPGIFEEYRPQAFLLDTYLPGKSGGTGQTFNWELAREAGKLSDRIILAGGLDPTNAAAAVTAARPWGVDVSSGVETAPGVKSRRRIREFVEAVRKAEKKTLCSPEKKD